MNNLSQKDFPFYTVYEQNKDIIDSAIDISVQDTANKLGKDLVNRLFSIKNNNQDHLQHGEMK